MANDIELYHITDINNLEKIIQHDALISKNALKELNISYTDIAEQNIQEKRSLRQVPLSPYGNLHDYVPFYLCPKSPMLFSIHKGNVKTYQNGQKEIIYLVIKLTQLTLYNLKCIYTNGQGIIDITEFYDDIPNLSKLDWNAIKSDDWGCPYYTNDPDKKRKKQAEFLVYQQVPWQIVYGIGVYNTIIEEQVGAIINPLKHKPMIKVKNDYYF